VVTLFQSLYTLSVVAGERASGRMASLKEERGASAVEYAMLVGVLAVVIIGALVLFGKKVTDLFDGINLSPTKATTPAGT
jgi:pilus assembly protein Flp/PilA